MTAADLVLLCLLTLLCALSSFRGLGDRAAPQSWCRFDDNSAVLTLPGESSVQRIMLYSGTGVGWIDVDLSFDGETWFPASSFEQRGDEILKWHELALTPVDYAAPLALRVTGSAGVCVGEIALFDPNGDLIPLSDSPLGDEQRLVPDWPSYLNSSYFDEIYHVRTALEHLRGEWPYEQSHPPLGKELIGLGIRLFGTTPFGWRFTGTLFGVLLLPVMYIFLKKLFGGIWIPCACTLILASDFMRFTQSRLATIDSYAVFFILLMFLFFYLWLTEEKHAKLYLALSGLSFGLGAASKWICLYAGAGLAVLWAAHWISRFCRFGKAELRPFARNVLLCLGVFVLLPGLIYVLSYLPYGRAAGLRGAGMLFSKDYLRIVWDNQQFMYSYHAGVNATHPYSSVWPQWLTDLRPILYYRQDYSDGSRSTIAAFLNPLLCWGGLLALPVLGVYGVKQRDNKALFLLIGYLAQLLPWMFVRRIVFEYHYFASSLFLVLALGCVFSKLEGRRRAAAALFTLMSVLLFAVYRPVLSGEWMDAVTAGTYLRWFSSWPV